MSINPIRFVGTAPRNEMPVTGVSARWWPGELKGITDQTRANALLRAGQGWELEPSDVTILDNVALWSDAEGTALLKPDGTESGVPGAGNFEVADFAALLAVSSPTAGRTYTVLGAICTGGATGTQWQWSGSLWRPACGQVLAAAQVQVDGASGGVTTEQFLFSPLFPAGVLRGVRRIFLSSQWRSSATDTNAFTYRWRLGVAGTASDTQIASFTEAATSRQVGVPATFVVVDDTTLIFAINTAGTPVHPATKTNTTGAASADTTVSSLLSSALYVSATVQQGAAPVATHSLSSAFIYVE